MTSIPPPPTESNPSRHSSAPSTFSKDPCKASSSLLGAALNGDELRSRSAPTASEVLVVQVEAVSGGTHRFTDRTFELLLRESSEEGGTRVGQSNTTEGIGEEGEPAEICPDFCRGEVVRNEQRLNEDLYAEEEQKVEITEVETALSRECTKEYFVGMIDQLVDSSSYHPEHMGSFGVSSSFEGYLASLSRPEESFLEEVGYFLTPMQHAILRRERGVRIRFAEGDKVTDPENSKVEGVVVESSGANAEVVKVCYGDDDGVDTYEEEIGMIYHKEDQDSSPDKNSPFEFKIKSLARRFPDEVWLRGDFLTHHKKTTTKEKNKGGGEPKVSGEGVKEAGMCCICLDAKRDLLIGPCCRAPQHARSSRPSECDVAICPSCLSLHCESSIASSRYSAAPVRCPGVQCGGRRLPMETWAPYVTIVDLLQYVHAPRQLMSIRCESCDNLSDLFPRAAMGRIQRRAVYEKLFEIFKDGQQGISMKQLVQVWRSFAIGEATPDETVRKFETLVTGKKDEDDAVLGKDEMDFVVKLMLGEECSEGGLFSLVVDVERRAALSLSLLRRYPFVHMRCCNTPICFKCKVSGHHEGISCDELQKEALEIDAQFCPQCGVATVRVDGCCHMVCVCGANWQWDGDGDY